ncbi:MAG: hypothetical protein WBP81_02770 [Solirubrobacteraceae bacterium]
MASLVCGELGEQFVAELAAAVAAEREAVRLVNLCGYPHRLTYAEAVTMPRIDSVAAGDPDDGGARAPAAGRHVGIVSVG